LGLSCPPLPDLLTRCEESARHLAQLAAGREDDHDPVARIRRERDRPTGGDRLVVGMGVKEHECVGHAPYSRAGPTDPSIGCRSPVRIFPPAPLRMFVLVTVVMMCADIAPAGAASPSRFGVSDDEIAIGSIVAATNPFGRPFADAYDGARAYFEALN